MAKKTKTEKIKIDKHRTELWIEQNQPHKKQKVNLCASE